MEWMFASYRPLLKTGFTHCESRSLGSGLRPSWFSPSEVATKVLTSPWLTAACETSSQHRRSQRTVGGNCCPQA